jgi:hypothetical protein
MLPAMNPAEAVRCSPQNQNLPFFLGLSDINSIPVVVCNWEGKCGGFWYFSRKCGGFFSEFSEIKSMFVGFCSHLFRLA